MPNLIYLAQPYSHPDSVVRQTRYQAARYATARLMHANAVFSPIVHGVGVEGLLDSTRSRSHEFWMAQCYAHLRRADAMYVLPLVEWRESRGLKEELAFARSAQIPVYFIFELDAPVPNPWACFDLPLSEELSAENWQAITLSSWATSVDITRKGAAHA